MPKRALRLRSERSFSCFLFQGSLSSQEDKPPYKWPFFQKMKKIRQSRQKTLEKGRILCYTFFIPISVYFYAAVPHVALRFIGGLYAR